MERIPIRFLTPESFSKYGRILEPMPKEKANAKSETFAFYVLERAVSEGWRMAYWIISHRSCEELEEHPNSKETFEPIKGVAILIVAPHDDANSVEAFLLDKPVIINEGVWHGDLSLSNEVHMRINENLDVQSGTHKLPFKIKAELYLERV